MRLVEREGDRRLMLMVQVSPTVPDLDVRKKIVPEFELFLRY